MCMCASSPVSIVLCDLSTHITLQCWFNCGQIHCRKYSMSYVCLFAAVQPVYCFQGSYRPWKVLELKC